MKRLPVVLTRGQWANYYERRWRRHGRFDALHLALWYEILDQAP